jgi:phage/plasmid-like protein (TIGR03299 family)
MSHELDFSTGKPAMAYVGERPWHRLGNELKAGQSIDEWVKAAGLDWDIQMLPVQFFVDDEYHLMPARFVLARSDTHQPLSVVSDEYTPVQPREVLEFYRDLVARRHYTLETAGALNGGRKVWALARTGLVANVADNPADTLGAFVLLATSCDKSLATTATFTSVRVVCQNTLNFAVTDMKSAGRRSIKVNHSQKFNADQIHEELGLMDASWDSFKEKLNPLCSRKLDLTDAREYFLKLLLSDAELNAGKISEKKNRELLQLLSLFDAAPGQSIETAKRTLWGAVNAVTYFVDHVRGGANERVDSAWFGSGGVLKARAWSEALAMLE